MFKYTLTNVVIFSLNVLFLIGTLLIVVVHQKNHQLDRVVYEILKNIMSNYFKVAHYQINCRQATYQFIKIYYQRDVDLQA